MARLPQPGGDTGTWGQLLNDFLAVAHDTNGNIMPSTLTDNSVPGSKLQTSSVTNAQLDTGTGSNGQVLTKDSAATGGFAWTSVAGSPDATTSAKGLVQLAGDLGGTGTAATAPVISNNAITTVKINDSAVTSAKIADGTIVNADISASAAIAKSKLASLAIVDADVASGAAIAKSKLAALNIGDADVSAISESKVTNLTTDLAATEKTANKGAVNGYAGLNSSSRVPSAQLGSGTADTTTYLRGDGAWTAAPVTSVASKTGAVTLVKGDVGLGNVDNTSDASKPVSTAQQTALDGKVNVSNGGGETYFDALNSGTAKTLDLANGNVQKLTLTGNCTITLTSPVTGAYRSMLIYVFQDGTGSRTITWPGSVHWGTAGAPTLSTGAGKMDKILLDTVDGGTTWYGTTGPGGF
jgi:hypothetical protein